MYVNNGASADAEAERIAITAFAILVAKPG
jgi:hypothetical protein